MSSSVSRLYQDGCGVMQVEAPPDPVLVLGPRGQQRRRRRRLQGEGVDGGARDPLAPDVGLQGIEIDEPAAGAVDQQ